MSTVITDIEAMEFVSENLRRILDEQGHNIRWLVLTLKASPGTIYPIARGEAMPSIATVARISEALGVSIDILLENPAELKRKKTSRKIRKTA
jgi:transcriptional regulator with XRE-family HTH domain